MKRDLILEKNIVIDYIDGIDNKELTIKYNRSRSYVQQVLKRNNIKLRNGSDVAKKYIVNENYFYMIDSRNKAYILGMLYADGTITKSGVRLVLKETDGQILYDIGNELFSNKPPIKKIEGRLKEWGSKQYYSAPQKSLSISRKKIKDDLKKWGLIERKTYKIRIPDLSDKLMNDFMRGYFDGDGCFYVSDNYPNNNRINIVSNNSFISDLKKLIIEKLDITVKVNSVSEGISRLNIYGNLQSKKFLDYIYHDDPQLKLQRKYNKYIEAYYPNKSDNSYFSSIYKKL